MAAQLMRDSYIERKVQSFRDQSDAKWFDNQILNHLEQQTVSGERPSRPLELLTAPVDYAQSFADVRRCQDLFILGSEDLHYTLYGYAQGRRHLLSYPTESSNVVIVSPSHLKQCGIGEYGRYLAGEFEKIGKRCTVVRTSAELFDLPDDIIESSLIIVNHGPGLYDGFNPRLSEGENTTALLQNLEIIAADKLAVPIIMMHSLIDRDQKLLYSRQQQVLASPIPTIVFIADAGKHFFLPTLELGISPVDVIDETRDSNRFERQEVIGFFGFFQYGGKDFSSLFHLAKQLRAKLVGSVAVSGRDVLDQFQETIDQANVDIEFGSGWVDDSELVDRLREADYFYLPQNDYDHWNNSATARFVTNMDRPLFLPPFQPFLDMEDGAIFATTYDLPRTVANFRSERRYEEAVERVRKFRKRAAMRNTAKGFTNDVKSKIDAISDKLLFGPNELSLQRALELENAGEASAAKLIKSALVANFRSVQPVQYWRKHYELGDLLFTSPVETVHAIHAAFRKRQPSFGELLKFANGFEQGKTEGSSSSDVLADLIATCATKDEHIFVSADTILVEHGNIVNLDEQSLSGKIGQALSQKHQSQDAISEHIKITEDRTTREVDNLFEVLALETDNLSRISIPNIAKDLAWGSILSHPTINERFLALSSQCFEAGINVGDCFVLDHPQPTPVDHLRTTYSASEFYLYEDNYFVLNAVRCLYKRNPFPLELTVLIDLMKQYGRKTVLEVMVNSRCARALIPDLSDEASDFRIRNFRDYVEHLRDPVAGGIEKRNAYEIAKRNNGRDLFNINATAEEYLSHANGNRRLLRAMYMRLSGIDFEPGQKVREYDSSLANWLGANGAMLLETNPGAIDVVSVDVAKLVDIETLPLDLAGRLLLNFHPAGAGGAWMNGATSAISFKVNGLEQINKDEAKGILDVCLSPFAWDMIGPQSILFETSTSGTKTISSTTYNLSENGPHTVSLQIGEIKDGDDVFVSITIEKSDSPSALGLSGDVREIGLMLHSMLLKTQHLSEVK